MRATSSASPLTRHHRDADRRRRGRPTSRSPRPRCSRTPRRTSSRSWTRRTWTGTPMIVSEPVEITGINTAAPILVTGGEYSIDGGPFTAEPAPSPTARRSSVRHTSASTSGTAVTTTLSVGPAGCGHPGVGCLQQRHPAERRQQFSRRADPRRAGPAGPGPAAPEEPGLAPYRRRRLQASRKRATPVALFFLREVKQLSATGQQRLPLCKAAHCQTINFPYSSDPEGTGKPGVNRGRKVSGLALQHD